MKTPAILFLLMFLFTLTGLNAQNPRINLLEDQTFTSCGCCPCLDSIVRKCIIPRVPNSVFVRYHFAWSSLHSQNCDSLMTKVVANGRKLSINRNGMILPEPDFSKDWYLFCDRVVDILKEDTVAPVKIDLKSKSYNEQTRKLDFTMDFSPYQADLSGTFMMNVVITENNVLARQSFHDSCGKPKGGDYDILHFNVVRQMAYYLYADTLFSGNWQTSNTLSRNFSIDLDPQWVPSNCEFTAYVYKQADSICHSKVQQALRQSVTQPLGVEPAEPTEARISVVPSPAAGLTNAHIPVDVPGKLILRISDMAGNLVETFPVVQAEKGTYNLEFDVSGYKAGTYLLHGSVNGKSFAEKFIVVKK